MQPSLPTPQQSHVASELAPQAQPVALKPVSQPTQVNQAAVTTNPATAADDEVLEKEWVQRLKHIIATTKHDPFMQEHEISKLQADYLMKRYGKQVRIPSDE